MQKFFLCAFLLRFLGYIAMNERDKRQKTQGKTPRFLVLKGVESLKNARFCPLFWQYRGSNPVILSPQMSHQLSQQPAKRAFSRTIQMCIFGVTSLNHRLIGAVKNTACFLRSLRPVFRRFRGLTLSWWGMGTKKARSTTTRPIKSRLNPNDAAVRGLKIQAESL